VEIRISKYLIVCYFFEGIFGERIGRALQKIHEKNGARFYSEANVIEITVWREHYLLIK